ncbi:hypothetical protein WDU94_000413 [Cyamophila willieti]
MYEAHSINAEHKDLIHDVAYDYYGLRMATCSSDQNIKVWDQDENGKWYLSANWKAHSGSVWKVTWAHPEFGQVIATCSFDRTAVVWEEVGPSPVQAEKTVHQWIRRTNLVDSRTSVTDVKFGPKSLGLVLATCSADGLVRIYEAPDVMNLSQWNLQHEVACPTLASCLTWNHSFSRDVMGCRFDIEIIGNLEEHSTTVWRVSWNVTGTIIASSGDDGCVRLWKSHHTNGFRCISVLKADGTQAKLPGASEPQPSSVGGSVGSRNQTGMTTSGGATSQQQPLVNPIGQSLAIKFMKLGAITNADQVPWH